MNILRPFQGCATSRTTVATVLNCLRMKLRRELQFEDCPGRPALLALLMVSTLVPAAQSAPRNANLPHPVKTFPVAPLGYRPTGSLYLLARLSSMSLDYVDDEHLLFTFHQFRLMNREPEPGHDDQNIRAVVIDVPSGKTTATAEWRMHDRRQYLFPLGGGAFLVRQGSEFSRVREDLQLHPYLRFKQRLLSVQLSPDGQLLTVQADLERHSEEKHKRLVEEAVANGESLPDEDVAIQMIQLDHRNIVASARSESPIRLAASSAGYLDHEQLGARQWKVNLHLFDQSVKPLHEVVSTCPPTEDFIQAETIMITTCSPRSADRYVQAFDTMGKELWTGQWDARYMWPTFGTAFKGQNFAISWLRISHPVDALDPLNDDDIQGQVVQVLSAATGHLLLAVNATPVISAGQNFALSADGSHLAVLNDGSIEIYDVPPDPGK